MRTPRGDHIISILLTAVALAAAATLLGAGVTTLMLTFADPGMTRLDAISNYVGGVGLVLIATGIVAYIGKEGPL